MDAGSSCQGCYRLAHRAHLSPAVHEVDYLKERKGSLATRAQERCGTEPSSRLPYKDERSIDNNKQGNNNKGLHLFRCPLPAPDGPCVLTRPLGEDGINNNKQYISSTFSPVY